jgi:hypothetical protein
VNFWRRAEMAARDDPRRLLLGEGDERGSGSMSYAYRRNSSIRNHF